MCFTLLEVTSSILDLNFLIAIVQRAVASANKKATVRFQELNQKKYRTPLLVISIRFFTFLVHYIPNPVDFFK